MLHNRPLLLKGCDGESCFLISRCLMVWCPANSFISSRWKCILQKSCDGSGGLLAVQNTERHLELCGALRKRRNSNPFTCGSLAPWPGFLLHPPPSAPRPPPELSVSGFNSNTFSMPNAAGGKNVGTELSLGSSPCAALCCACLSPPLART